MISFKKWYAIVGMVFLFVLSDASAQNLAEFEKKVTTFTLDNGLTFIVVKRDVAPVVSFVTYVDVGGVNEPLGNTGIAHIFEHMVFKGDTYIGTTNWEEEKVVIEQLDQAYIGWYRENSKPNPDQAKLDALWSEFTRLQDVAKTYVKNNEFTQIIEQNGGNGINAATGPEQTCYY